ncbi:MAG: HAD family hydrolase [Actinobacteria bacterium]|nr:MAG: HAD family hydrolase [Actinomycetota bacterium]
MAVARKAVFVDKDGTLIENIPFNVDPRLIHFTAGAERGLRVLADAGYEIVVVSNQSGVARGYFEERALEGVQRRLREMLAAAGLEMSGFYYCPHLPEGRVQGYGKACECRKPLPGLLTRAAADLRLDLASSWMIGDILHDVEAGTRAGCGSVLLDAGNETEWQLSPLRVPQFVARDLEEAAAFITSVGPLVHSWDTMTAAMRNEIAVMGGSV